MPDGRRVLLVEDDAVLGDMLHEVLEAAGHRVDLVSTRRGALAAVKANRPDVLCVDIDLPDGTGWELIDDLERVEELPETVIVATAGMDASRSRRRPGTYLLPKPFPIDSLLRLVGGVERPEI
jgi:DNA-binding response OmpR family regulator